MTTKLSSGIKARRLRKLLHRLVDIYSPSGKEEEILHFLCGYLKRHGLPVIMQPVDTNRYNLVVNPSPDAAAAVFVAHVDTVVAYDLDHLGCVEKGDIIGGLGAADMKGGCAAMIEAWISFMEAASSPPPVALALVVGEEEEGDGAQKLVKEYHFPWALIGEPTDLHPCLAHYGYIEVQLTATGRRMHASLANQGRNPVETMLQLLLKISHFLASEHPELVYNIRDLSSARAGFAVPERCNAWLDIHLPPTAPLGEISAEIEEILIREKQLHRKFNASLRFANIHSGYELPEKGDLVDILREILPRHSSPWTPQAFRSHSDANLLWAHGTKPILLGPGVLEKAHAPDESISFDQVLSASRIYYDIMKALTAREQKVGNQNPDRQSFGENFHPD
ncbi:MAG: M20/M25/M40 family metallo-hydrolase [Syntrophobacteraceae bacterium]|nr:M20/M25/M40 family metallo-hydrolase [Syntrophobacteraceae bacterium]